MIGKILVLAAVEHWTANVADGHQAFRDLLGKLKTV
jgi:hypothetical protein